MNVDIEMKKAGQTRKQQEKAQGFLTGAPVNMSPEKANEVIYPSMYVNSDEMPAIEGLEFGKHYTMLADVHVAEKTAEEKNGGKSKHRARIEIHQVGFKKRAASKRAAEMTDDELAEAAKTGKSAD